MCKDYIVKHSHYYFDADTASSMYFKEDPVLDKEPHFHDSVEFIFIKKGEILCHSEDKSQILTEGDIFFSESYETHFYEVQGDITAIVLVLSREYTQVFRQLYPDTTFSTYLTNKEANKEIFDLINKWIVKENKTQIGNYGEVNLLLSLLVEKYKMIPRTQNEGGMLEKELLRYIHLHFLEDFTVISMAHNLGYSPEYCSKVLKKCLKCGIKTYVNSLRFKKASELLSDKSLNLTQSEVLYQCGFSSQSTYYRVKKQFEK